MAAGKRKMAMIACVTFETVKITEPVKFYDVDKVHLIHYVKQPESRDGIVYREFYDEVCRIIGKNSDNRIEITEHEEQVSQFLPMLKLILKIMDEELNSKEYVDLYINISAGTSEYTAAAVIASMMNPSVIPFSVGTDQYTVRDDKIRDAFYRDGMPVGLTETVFEPMMVPKYNMPMPEKNLVLGLRILGEMIKAKRNVKGPNVIKALKENGLWRRLSEDADMQGDMKPGKSDSVYYDRDYVKKWSANGWVVKDDFYKRYVLTDEGRRIIETFYTK
jgi:hypothetical protein